MTTNRIPQLRTLLIAACLLAAAGLALTAAGPSSAPADGAAVVLEYKMPSGRTLTYESRTEEAQIMDVMGQIIDTQTGGTSTFTFTSKGRKDKDYLLGVTIDDLAMNISSSVQGNMSPDMGGIKGKSFDMVLSPLGSEVDIAGAEALTYDIEAETRNLASSFKMYFPDLPGRPVDVGDTWPSNGVIEENTGMMSIRVDIQTVNTLEGFETVDGMPCARISAEVKGAISGSGSQMGMDMTFGGTVSGKDVWYFAVKDGIYVKTTSESTSEMSVDVPAAGMTIPVTGTTKSEVKLTGRK